MANPAVQAGRDWFEKKLRETATERKVPIDYVSWNDIPEQDASDLVIRSGDKEERRKIKDLDLISNKPNVTLVTHIDKIVNFLIADS